MVSNDAGKGNKLKKVQNNKNAFQWTLIFFLVPSAYAETVDFLTSLFKLYNSYSGKNTK